jgi:hypothetical protein
MKTAPVHVERQRPPSLANVDPATELSPGLTFGDLIAYVESCGGRMPVPYNGNSGDLAKLLGVRPFLEIILRGEENVYFSKYPTLNKDKFPSISEDEAMALAHRFGGGSLPVPSLKSLLWACRQDLARQLRKEGTPASVIARRFAVTPRAVRMWTKDSEKAAVKAMPRFAVRVERKSPEDALKYWHWRWYRHIDPQEALAVYRSVGNYNAAARKLDISGHVLRRIIAVAELETSGNG